MCKFGGRGQEDVAETFVSDTRRRGRASPPRLGTGGWRSHPAVQVINQSKDIIISESAEFASSFFSRLLGLMLSQKKDLVLISPKEDIASSSIHMCLMRFPIDLIWLNSDMIVVDIQKRILPFNPFDRKTWRIYRPRNAAKYVIELGIGNSDGTEIMNLVEFC